MLTVEGAVSTDWEGWRGKNKAERSNESKGRQEKPSTYSFVKQDVRRGAVLERLAF
jgi:hypothetical protein